MDRKQLDDACEKTILGLVLAILVFGPLALGAVDSWAWLVIEGLALAATVVWVVRLWVSPRPQLLWPPVCWAVLAFAGYAVGRYWQAEIEYAARQELIRILIYALLFFVILNNLHQQESTQIIVLTMVFLGMGISFYAGSQLLMKTPRVWFLPTIYPGRGSGTYGYPNALAGFLEMLLPLGLSYTLIGRLSHVTKIFLGYASLVIIAGIGFTMSRGGWLVTGVVLAVFCGVLLTQRDYRMQALILLLVLALAGVFFIPKAHAARQRFEKTFSSGQPDDMRLSIWRAAGQMWRDHFWWGVGPAHFDYEFRIYRPVEVQLRPNRVHNDYLNLAVDWGVTGVALVAGVLSALAWGVFRAWRPVRGVRDDFARKKSGKFAFLVGASLGLLGILLHSMVDFNLHIPANAILTVALMALLSSQLRFATERFWVNAGNLGKSLASLVLLAAVAGLGTQGWRGAKECFWLLQAGQKPEFSSARIAALEQAFRAEPKNFETAYNLGECYRIKSWSGGQQYVNLARKAMGWYQTGMKLNPFDGYNWLRYGMCLDWIGGAEGAPEDSATYYDRANRLDPNGSFTTVNTGWHYVQTGDYAAARSCFERARQLDPKNSDSAQRYLPIVAQRLEESAAQKR